MHGLDLADDTFLAVPGDLVSAAVAEPAFLRRHWSELVLRVYADRGVKGRCWTVDGPLHGTMEVWLEPVLDGTVLHYYLRVDPVGPDGRPLDLTPAARGRLARRWRIIGRGAALELKLRLEAGREPGLAP
ncbi:polyketide cyclase / dehydrase and lipid transport [Actinoalloteichus hymeniacidonis]|uniref:Polyketide cyclase / dehydrase and lipid transport n=1 Tax=Actinoalloteichus hymeniacidonis TaxID=340345 RepID=A0AAC9MZ77_9PSEU|nr:polyketide cyclase / dehydrase and lipid transport [Actinoalloteichus hymeniacidonis]AOS65128.1 hypothetical protein TL08_21705 [Actinoalloteichus hymeniacidonis]MBB5906793.1 hypothetical protein [Actinoalloteichus hymeniacidonis]